ncbi:MAG: tryptophan--tRNA ligase [Clostridia bacterium]|nr:tryptophan--tRNA ligase [Clostridia bacterium]
MVQFSKDKKTIFSGAQPTGNLHIGNYLGALRNWALLQNDYNCIYCVVDMHAITVRQVPAELRKRSLETLARYMACGIDPEKVIFFIQSHVPEHAQLSWVLNCSTMFGELSRMTQFKDKTARHADNVNAGLFTYPVLMAADILLYNADLVPVGDDQKQHLELARDVAGRFNAAYSPTFTLPEPYILKTSSRIMSLTDPTKKMSKSDTNTQSWVSLLDTRDDIIKKFKRAVTDSGSEIRADAERPGITNLINIYSSFSGKSVEETEKEFEGKGYGDFKAAVGEVCADALGKIRENFDSFMNDRAQLDRIITEGAQAAEAIARKTISKVYRKIGFYSPEAKK